MSNEYVRTGAVTLLPRGLTVSNYITTSEGYMTYRYGSKDLNWYYDDNGYT